MLEITLLEINEFFDNVVKKFVNFWTSEYGFEQYVTKVIKMARSTKNDFVKTDVFSLIFEQFLL